MENTVISPKVTLGYILDVVSNVTSIDKENILMPDKVPGARKREYVNARHISMCLSKMYTQNSLGNIGWFHGKRDHATVLSSYKAVNNMLDVNDAMIAEPFYISKNIIDNYIKNKTIKEKEVFLSDYEIKYSQFLEAELYRFKNWFNNQGHMITITTRDIREYIESATMIKQ